MAFGGFAKYGLAAVCALGGAALGIGACASGSSAPDGDGGSSSTTSLGGAGGAGGAGGEATGGGGGQGGAACSGDPCKLVPPQCGCPSSERCHWNYSGAECVADGTQESSEACDNDCVAGYRCVDNHEGGPRICHQYCETDDDCLGPGSLCIVGFGSPDYRVCTHNCDPISDVGCAETDMKCDIFRETDPPNRSLTQCAGSGSLGQGQECATTSDCAPGYSCFGITGQTGEWCMKWCDVNAATSGCPAGTTCYPFSSPIIIGSIEYGACGN